MTKNILIPFEGGYYSQRTKPSLASEDPLTDQEKVILSLYYEIEKLKGMERDGCTHRCSYCESFYATEENPLDEIDDKNICPNCSFEVLNEKIQEVKIREQDLIIGSYLQGAMEGHNLSYGLEYHNLLAEKTEEANKYYNKLNL